MHGVQTSIPALPVVAPLVFGWGLVVAARAKTRRPGWGGPAALTRLAWGWYVIGVLAVTLLPLDIQTGDYANQAPWYSSINPVPLVTIDAPTFVLNIAMLLPLGVLLPLTMRAASLPRTALIALLVALAIETLQTVLDAAISHGRTGDVNDIFANVLGAMLGVLIVRAALRIPSLAPLAVRLALPDARVRA